MGNVEKLRSIAVPMSEKDKQASEFRMNNRLWLRKSRRIALSVMQRLEVLDMKKEELAERMGVQPSYIDRMLKGKENITLEIICKLEEVLGVEFIRCNYGE